MPQTTYNIDNDAAVAGQAVDLRRKSGSKQASEQIPAGQMTELHTDGKLRRYRGGKRWGISLYRDAKEPGPWEIDDYVPVCQEGDVWCEFDGESDNVTEAGAPIDLNIHGAATTATKRGKFTDSAPSDATDAQIWGGGASRSASAATADAGLVLVSVNISCDQSDEDEMAPIELAVAAGDYAVPASAKNEQVFELGATAANSTVSLPAVSKNGKKLYFFADGTKNGHTLTFRDVTTNISAATTASKRVAAVALRVAGAWVVTLTVGP